jgi:predicted dehydrogenase
MAYRLFVLAAAVAAAAFAGDLRIGIVGTDTSHAVEFTRILNDAAAPDHVAGGRVVAAYKGGSPDVESSRTRVDKFAETLRAQYQVEFVPEIAALCGKVDAVLLESVDGRAHLPQAREVFRCGKPVFIDKPLAATLEDAREIAALARKAGVPWFSSSSVRYSAMAAALKGGEIRGVDTWGPGPVEPHHRLDLSWYGIHAVELLYTLMGPGCEEVTRLAGGTAESGSDVMAARWKDGRTATVRTIRPYGQFGANALRPDGSVVRSPEKDDVGYNGLLREIIEFFRSGKPPVANEETIEMFSFMDAAQRSKENGGRPVKLP